SPGPGTEYALGWRICGTQPDHAPAGSLGRADPAGVAGAQLGNPRHGISARRITTGDSDEPGSVRTPIFRRSSIWHHTGYIVGTAAALSLVQPNHDSQHDCCRDFPLALAGAANLLRSPVFSGRARASNEGSVLHTL